MSNTESVTINTGDEGNKGPSLEEQLETLQKEGLIDPEGDVPGQDEDAQGGAEPGSEDGATDDDASSVPDKFKNPDGTVNTEALLKSYKELEQKNSQKDEDDTEAQPQEAAVTEEERKAAEEATKKAGLDLNEVSAEWWENDGLSDATYTKLAEAGYPKEMVDIYIEGLTSRTVNTSASAYEIAGGEDKYEEMAEWASDNLSEAEVAAYDKAVNSKDAETALMAVRGLKARYDSEMAKDASEEPEEVVTSKGQVKGDVYESMDDYMADMNDPKYDENETFRKKVMAKLARSNI